MTSEQQDRDETVKQVHPLRTAYLAELRHIVRCLPVADVLSAIAQEATYKASHMGGHAGDVWRAAAQDLGNVAAEYRDKGL